MTTRENKERFVLAISRLCVAFSKEFTEETIEIWSEALADLPIEAVERAVVTAVRELKTKPYPAHIRELAGAKSAEVSVAEKAETAWRQVREAAKRSELPDDEIAAMVVSGLGGSRRLGQMSDKEMDFVKKDFVHAYRQISVGRELVPF